MPDELPSWARKLLDLYNGMEVPVAEKSETGLDDSGTSGHQATKVAKQEPSNQPQRVEILPKGGPSDLDHELCRRRLAALSLSQRS